MLRLQENVCRFARVLSQASLGVVMALSVAVVSASDLKGKAQSVVKLYITSQGWNVNQPWVKGGVRSQVCTGFAIESGILTNAHCVTDATYMEIEVPGVANRIEAKRVAISHFVDLAIIDFKDRDKAPELTPISLGKLPHLRDKVVTIGYPVGGRQVSYTEGVVSRIDVMKYVHSGVINLLVQTDAAINPGNSGGPVFSDETGECLGVATQIARGSSIGYFIPRDVIRQFLTDLEDGHVDGTPGLGLPSQNLESEAIRSFLMMDAGQTGVRLVDIPKGVPSLSELRKGDVILEVDGHRVMNDGQVPFRGDGRIGFAYYISNHQVGERLNLTLLRDGAELAMSVTLGALDYRMVPIVPEFERQPEYYEMAGIVFRRLEPRFINKQNYPKLRSYIKKMKGDIPGVSEIVLIGGVYPSKLSKGYSAELYKRVVKINGHRIGQLKDIPEALSGSPDKGYHVIELDDGHAIVLKRSEVVAQEASIRKRYGIKPSPFFRSH